jgi:hypothetical protein
MMWTPGLRSLRDLAKIAGRGSSIISSGASPAWWVIASAWIRSPLRTFSAGASAASK